MAARRDSSRFVTSMPQICTRPCVGRRSAPEIVRSGVLPDPDGPMIATISPPWIWSETSSSAVTLDSPERYILLTPSRLRMSPGESASPGLTFEDAHGVDVREPPHRYVRREQRH